MAGKRKQGECRLTNEQQEKRVEPYHNESNIWNVSSASKPRKKVAKVYYYIQNKILAQAIIINRIGAKISNSSIVRTRVYMRDGG